MGSKKRMKPRGGPGSNQYQTVGTPAWPTRALAASQIASSVSRPPPSSVVSDVDRGELDELAVRYERGDKLTAREWLLLAKHPGDRVRQDLATGGDTPGAVLSELLRDTNKAVSQAAAVNANLPKSAIRRAIMVGDHRVCENPSLPDSMARDLINRPSGGSYGGMADGLRSDAVRRALARNLGLSRESQVALVKSVCAALPTKKPKDRTVPRATGGQSTARDVCAQFLDPKRDTPVGVLNVIADAGSQELNRKLAAHPNCAPSTLVQLAQVADLVPVVAANPNLPTKTLVRLSRSATQQVRVAVAGNASCPPPVLDRLAFDKDAVVRTAACRNPSCPDESRAAAAFL